LKRKKIENYSGQILAQKQKNEQNEIYKRQIVTKMRTFPILPIITD